MITTIIFLVGFSVAAVLVFLSLVIGIAVTYELCRKQ